MVTLHLFSVNSVNTDPLSTWRVRRFAEQIIIIARWVQFIIRQYPVSSLCVSSPAAAPLHMIKRSGDTLSLQYSTPQHGMGRTISYE